MSNSVKASLLSLLVLAGCAKPEPPPKGVIDAYLRQHAPEGVVLRQIDVKAMEPAAEAWHVRFEATASPTEQHYEIVDLASELGKLSWAPSVRSGDAAQPVLFRSSQRPSEVVPVTGELMVSGTGPWDIRNFTWNLDQQLRGHRRSELPPEALPLASREANDPVRRYIQLGKFATFPVNTGAVYRDAKLDTFYPDSVLVVHTKGVSQVNFEELPAALQSFLYYDARAVERAKTQRDAIARERQEFARQQALAEEIQAAQRDRTASDSRPAAPPSDVENIVSEHLRQYTTSPSSIIVKAGSATYDDAAWAWKIECEYSYLHTRRGTAGGQRVEGKSYAWFRDKLLVRWRDIVPPRSPYN